MGTYNVVLAKLNCPTCHKVSEFKIQYKHGDCWLYEYHIGDKISWGGLDHGIPEQKKAHVEGISEPCTICGQDGILWKVLIEDDTIMSVTLKEVDIKPMIAEPN